MRLNKLGWTYLVMTVLALLGCGASYIEDRKMLPAFVFIIALGVVGIWRLGFDKRK